MKPNPYFWDEFELAWKAAARKVAETGRKQGLAFALKEMVFAQRAIQEAMQKEGREL